MQREEDTARTQEELFVKEPWIVDESYEWYIETLKPDPELEKDNIRIWVPLDLNHAAILRRLRFILDRYGEITWKNESNVFGDVARLTYQIEKYDQINLARNPEKKTEKGEHSKAGLELVKEFINILEGLETCCDFPDDIISSLKAEFFEN